MWLNLWAIVGVVGAGALVGCSAARESVPCAERLGGPAPAAVAHTSGATEPMDATALARELGLDVASAGPGVVLSNSDLRARFFPGSERMTIDGRAVLMGSEARRVGPSILVPAVGVAALRVAVSQAAQRRTALARPAAPVAARMISAAQIAPTPVVLTPVSLTKARPTSGGDPTWVPSVSERSWKYVVVHHSDDTCGCCAKYDSVHRGKGWENGCGYHFVIGNGSQSGDGEIEIGPRWTRQIQGAHAKTADNRFNETGVGVVLVGDFEHGGRPTARQYESLVRLTRWLMARYGIGADAVLRHADCKSTACPGRNFPWAKYTADVAR